MRGSVAKKPKKKSKRSTNKLKNWRFEPKFKDKPANTHWKGKYQCMAGLNINQIGFYQTRKYVCSKATKP